MTKPCENVKRCGTEVLEAKSSLELGVCLRCRGYYGAINENEQARIYNEGLEPNNKGVNNE